MSNVIQNEFATYGKDANALMTGFSSYATGSNVINNSFKAYDQWGNATTGGFTSYADDGNRVTNEFQNYAANVNGNDESFTNYGHLAGTQQSVFKSYGKNANGAGITFTTYGNKTWFDSSSEFVQYANGSNNPNVAFNSYSLNFNFKDCQVWHDVFILQQDGQSDGGRGWKVLQGESVGAGKTLPMPDIKDYMPKRSFIPVSLADKLPFSTQTLSELINMFHILENSTMCLTRHPKNIRLLLYNFFEIILPFLELTSCFQC